MGGRYSGNLVRSYANPNGDGSNLSNPYPDTRHKALGHQADGTDQYPDAHQVPAGQVPELNGTDFPNDVTVGGGLVVANPDLRDHVGTAALYPIYSDDQEQQSIAKAHAANSDRASIGSAWGPPPLQSFREVYSEQVYDDLNPLQGPNTEGAPAIMRGINSYSMNNPMDTVPKQVGYVDGVRPGIQRHLDVRRQRLQSRRRVYDLQPLDERSYGHNVPVNVAAPADPPMYGPVLPTWQPAGAWNRLKSPGIWRNPGTVDDRLLAAGDGADSSVIGGEL